MSRRGISLPGDPLPIIHGSVTYSYVTTDRICDGTKTACGRSDEDREITVITANVTCKQCLVWIGNHGPKDKIIPE